MDPPQDSVSISIPAHISPLVCIEYPGYVGSLDRVTETLGGSRFLRDLVKDPPTTIPLRFRPDDPRSHPTMGSKEPVRRVLLRLPSASASESSALSAQIVGVADVAYRFDAPADMQYVTGAAVERGRRAAEGQRAGAALDVVDACDIEADEPPGFDPEPLLAAPPVFLKGPARQYTALAVKAAARKPQKPTPPEPLALPPGQQAPAAPASDPVPAEASGEPPAGALQASEAAAAETRPPEAPRVAPAADQTAAVADMEEIMAAPGYDIPSEEDSE